MSGTGGGITKLGAGTLVLSGANTYTGTTLVSAGTIVLGSKNGFGTGTVTLDGGVTLKTQFEGNSSGGALPNTLVLSGGTVNMSVSFSDKDIWINTAVSGAGGISVTGGGGIMRSPGLTLSGAKTFQGGVTIAADRTRVTIDNNSSLGTGGLRVASGTGTLRVSADLSDMANNVVVASGATLSVEVDSGKGAMLSGVAA